MACLLSEQRAGFGFVALERAGCPDIAHQRHRVLLARRRELPRWARAMGGWVEPRDGDGSSMGLDHTLVDLRCAGRSFPEGWERLAVDRHDLVSYQEG